MYCESRAALALRQFHYCLRAVERMGKKNDLFNEVGTMRVFEGMHGLLSILENKEGK